MCAPDERCDLATNRCVARPATTDTETTPVPAGPCQLQPVYFAFEENTLDAAATSAIEGNVRCMAERSIGTVSITGMCDPRGTEEYNMALGDRRARSVRDHMQRLGVERRSMTTRSVGEEMATGADEYGWSRDRRAETAAR